MARFKSSTPPGWRPSGPSLFIPLYLAMVAQGSILCWAVYGPQGFIDRWIVWSLGGFWLSMAFSGTFHILMNDWVNSLGGGGRVLYGLAFAIGFSWPGFAPDHRVLPEGFAVALPLLAFVAVGAPLVRVFVGYTILGFAIAALGEAPPSLPMTLGLTATTILTLTAAHFAFTGAAFGLRGWWGVGKILQISAIYFLPAALVAGATYFFWPEFVPDPPSEGAGSAAQSTARRVAQMDPEQIGRALLRLVLWLVTLIVSLALIYYLRRRLGRRSKPMDMPKIFGTDVSELQIERTEPAAVWPSLGGRRGRIVALWQRWQREYESRGLGRSSSETAAEMAQRVRADSPWRGSSKEALTELFERAHYGESEPTEEELAQMKRAVKEELAD